MTNRIVLAYSGGLDTTVAIPYLKKMIDGEVIAVRALSSCTVCPPRSLTSAIAKLATTKPPFQASRLELQVFRK